LTHVSGQRARLGGREPGKEMLDVGGHLGGLVELSKRRADLAVIAHGGSQDGNEPVSPPLPGNAIGSLLAGLSDPGTRRVAYGSSTSRGRKNARELESPRDTAMISASRTAAVVKK